MIRRIFDFSNAFIGLLMLIPLFAIAAILIKLDSKGPVFYKSKRVGKNGRIFNLYKFRSMVVDAEKWQKITYRNDPRITRIGKLLRRAKIDELPNLINVLKGDMSLIGPRPEIPHYVDKFTPQYKKILKIRPGITGFAQLRYIDEASQLEASNLDQNYINEVLSQKIKLDLEYVEKRSILTDIKILLATFGHIILNIFK